MRSPKEIINARLRRFEDSVVRRVDELFNVRAKKLEEKLLTLEKSVEQNDNKAQQALEILKAQRDSIDSLQEMLWQVRTTKKYQETFKNESPLITVRIATYNNSQGLVKKSIASVLNQTYQNFEIIVIGDHCTDDTEATINELKDERITFINLPYRSLYPDDGVFRWMVAGSPGMNIGTKLAKGSWIAPLDDDDEFTPDHIEKLLAAALQTKSELVYGALNQFNMETKEVKKVWSFPPTQGNFSFQGALYMKALNFFEYDQQSWVVREPGDWNLCRRMLLAGVKIHAIEDLLGTMYMFPVRKKIRS